MTHPTEAELDAAIAGLQLMLDQYRDKNAWEGYPRYLRDGIAAITALRAQLVEAQITAGIALHAQKQLEADLAEANAKAKIADAVVAEIVSILDAPAGWHPVYAARAIKQAHDQAHDDIARLVASNAELATEAEQLRAKVALQDDCIETFEDRIKGLVHHWQTAEAERAAQIEADAGLVREYEARLAKWAMQNGTHMSPYEALTEAADAIRAHPHSRPALDRIIAATRAKALRKVADLIHRIADGYDAGGDKAIACGLYLTEGNVRAMIDKEGA